MKNLSREESTLKNSMYPRITVGRDCLVCKLLAVLQGQLNEEMHLVLGHSQCSSATKFCPLTNDQWDFLSGVGCLQFSIGCLAYPINDILSSLMVLVGRFSLN